MNRPESDILNNPAFPARIQAEGCLSCGGSVRVIAESVLCMDCESLVGVDAYRKLFAIKAGYENIEPKGNAAK